MLWLGRNTSQTLIRAPLHCHMYIYIKVTTAWWRHGGHVFARLFVCLALERFCRCKLVIIVAPMQPCTHYYCQQCYCWTYAIRISQEVFYFPHHSSCVTCDIIAKVVGLHFCTHNWLTGMNVFCSSMCTQRFNPIGSFWRRHQVWKSRKKEVLWTS